MPSFEFLAAPFGDGPTGAPLVPPTHDRPEGLQFLVRALPADPTSASRLGYWMADGTDLELDVTLSLGTGFSSLYLEGRGLISFFVNGRSTPVLTADGVPTTTLALQLVDGVGQARISIPAAFFEQGGNLVHYIGRFEESPTNTELLYPPHWGPRADLVLRNGSELSFVDMAETDGYVAAAGHFGDTRLFFRDRNAMGFELEFFTSEAPLDGEYALRLDIESSHTAVCANQTDTLVVVAMLDGEEFAIGPDGRFVATVMADEKRSFELDLSGLPRDGEAHRLEIFQLYGFAGAPVEDDGSSAVWGRFSRLVGLARWR